MEIGTKYDEGKPRLAEMVISFREPIIGLCKVFEFGANKYGLDNWKNLENGEVRYLNAFLRHALSDEMIDAESGLPHCYHMLFNAMAYAYFVGRRLEHEQKKKL